MFICTTCHTIVSLEDCKKCEDCSIVFYCSDKCIEANKAFHKSFCTSNNNDYISQGNYILQTFCVTKVQKFLKAYTKKTSQTIVCEVSEVNNELLAIIRPGVIPDHTFVPIKGVISTAIKVLVAPGVHLAATLGHIIDKDYVVEKVYDDVFRDLGNPQHDQRLYCIVVNPNNDTVHVKVFNLDGTGFTSTI